MNECVHMHTCTVYMYACLWTQHMQRANTVEHKCTCACVCTVASGSPLPSQEHVTDHFQCQVAGQLRVDRA